MGPEAKLYKKIKKNLALINDVYKHIITNYVDDIDLDAFTKISINNMLMDLDPYTVFLENEERSGIEMLTKEELNWINSYHEKVFKTLSKFMREEELVWLKKSCKSILK